MRLGTNLLNQVDLSSVRTAQQPGCSRLIRRLRMILWRRGQVIQVRNARFGDPFSGVHPGHRGVPLPRYRMAVIYARFAATLLFGLAPLSAWAVKPVEEVLPGQEAKLPLSKAISYVNATDAELDALGARWGYLSAPERRALLAEVRRRMMQASGASGAKGNGSRVRIQATRQYGVVQRPDGTTIRVERRIIRMIPADQGYGTGFEQRAARDDSPLPATPREAERRALEQQQRLDAELPGAGAQQPLPRRESPQPGLPRGMMPVSTPAAVREHPDDAPSSR